MAVVRFVGHVQFRERLPDLREKKQRIVAEAIVAAGRIQDDAFGGAAEGGEGLAIAGGGDDADESRGALFGRHTGQFAQHARIVRFVVGVGFGGVRFVSGVARGMDAGRALQSVDFEAGIVGDDELARNGTTVGLSFLAGILLEGGAVFDNQGQGGEIRDRCNADAVRLGGSGKITQLAWIRSGDENAPARRWMSVSQGSLPLRGKLARACMEKRIQAIRLTMEIHPPMVRSRVWPKRIRMSFDPAMSGTCIWRVTSEVAVATCFPLIVTSHAG